MSVCKKHINQRLLCEQCMLVEVYKSQRKEPLLCREYYFLATENSRYFELSSKTNGQTKKETMHTFVSFNACECTHHTPSLWAWNLCCLIFQRNLTHHTQICMFQFNLPGKNNNYIKKYVTRQFEIGKFQHFVPLQPLLSLK